MCTHLFLVVCKHESSGRLSYNNRLYVVLVQQLVFYFTAL